MKNTLKKILPKALLSRFLPFYHFSRACFFALFYGFPSKNLCVIGVTGSKGKSSTVYITSRLLQALGYKVGWISSLSICDGEKERINPYHLTMLPPNLSQKELRKMLKNGCRFCVMEVSSEGIKTFRHIGIDFNVAVFTNLEPEHIEAHGSFENYKRAKLIFFKKTARGKGKGVVNIDNEHAGAFLEVFTKDRIVKVGKDKGADLRIEEIKRVGEGLEIKINGERFETGLKGEFNAYNVAMALGVLRALGKNWKDERVKRKLVNLKKIEGRWEEINRGQPFLVVVDLAHTPRSFEEVLKLAREYQKDTKGRIITVFGSAGGVRDKWKRPVLGEIAGKYSDVVILTNEDPYDEDPRKIIEEIAKGVVKNKNVELFKIEDREQAICEAFSIAREGDIVLLLGKGTEQSIVIKDKVIPWDERRVAERLLEEVYSKK